MINLFQSSRPRLTLQVTLWIVGSLAKLRKSVNPTSTCFHAISYPIQTFGIHCKIDQESPAQPFTKILDCIMDGATLRSIILCPDNLTRTISGARAGANSIRPFQFATLLVTGRFLFVISSTSTLITRPDDESITTNMDGQNIGLISIQIFRAGLDGQSSESSLDMSGHQTGSVHEKSKKAGAHCVS